MLWTAAPTVRSRVDSSIRKTSWVRRNNCSLFCVVCVVSLPEAKRLLYKTLDVSRDIFWSLKSRVNDVQLIQNKSLACLCLKNDAKGGTEWRKERTMCRLATVYWNMQRELSPPPRAPAVETPNHPHTLQRDAASVTRDGKTEDSQYIC